MIYIIEKEEKNIVEERYDIMEIINVFYSQRKDLQSDIDKEKDSDPSDEIDRIRYKVQKCDPIIGFMHPESKWDDALE